MNSANRVVTSRVVTIIVFGQFYRTGKRDTHWDGLEGGPSRRTEKVR